MSDSDDDIQWIPMDLPHNDIIFDAQRYDADGQFIGVQGVDIPGLDIQVLPNNEPAPQPVEWQQRDDEDRYAVHESQFVNPDEWQDYMCTLCLGVVDDPLIHETSPPPGCGTIFCRSCFLQAIEYNRNQHCPFRCNGDERLRYATCELPRFAVPGKRSREVLSNLKLRCKFQACQEELSFGDYRNHIDNCPANPIFSQLCDICNVVLRGHDCKTYIEGLRKSNDELREENERLTQENTRISQDLRSVRRELGDSRIRQGELTLANNILRRREEGRAQGFVNNIRSRNEYRNNATMVVRFGNRIERFGGIDLSTRASTLISRIERQFGTGLGSIIRCDYTVLGTYQTLRQHQIGHRPSFWIALPPNQRLRDGQTMEITIGNPGPVV